MRRSRIGFRRSPSRADGRAPPHEDAEVTLAGDVSDAGDQKSGQGIGEEGHVLVEHEEAERSRAR